MRYILDGMIDAPDMAVNSDNQAKHKTSICTSMLMTCGTRGKADRQTVRPNSRGQTAISWFGG
ncbi:hypothetical protein ARTHRO_11004 [Limnospira indica PCC 8005]|uniref:Uncharacterized protein n=1 Tax=Limnospira indica PCC 8005 TaxID=376219 RepID=A0A9P1KCV0_9CYAN|nr:hypothetical protein ARTHRO_11004 [Limnospira indica PCC 8005]